MYLLFCFCCWRACPREISLARKEEEEENERGENDKKNIEKNFFVFFFVFLLTFSFLKKKKPFSSVWASIMAVYAAGSATKRKALVSPPLDRLLATGTTSWGSITVGTLELGKSNTTTNTNKGTNAASSSSKQQQRDIAAGADPNHYSSSITVPMGRLRAGLGSSLSMRRRGGGAAAGGGEGGDSIDGGASASHPNRTTRAVARARGVAIFYSDALDSTPPVLAHLIARVPCLFECNIFLTNRVVPVAFVPPAERLLARSQPVQGFFSAVARYGYLERIQQDEAFASGVVSFVLGRLGRRICKAAGADGALREALGLPSEKFARALASDLGLDLGGEGGGATAAASLAALLAPSSRQGTGGKKGGAATVASVADAFADADACLCHLVHAQCTELHVDLVQGPGVKAGEQFQNPAFVFGGHPNLGSLLNDLFSDAVDTRIQPLDRLRAHRSIDCL